MGVVIYNGQSSEDFGLHVTYRPDYDLPVRDVEEITLPGRDGTILCDNGRYDKTERKYAMTFGDEDVDFYDMAIKMSEWLNSSPSEYVRLSDSYEPNVYRLARFVPDGPILPVLENAGGLEVKFECLPQRFYTEGDKPLVFKMEPIGNNLFDSSAYDQSEGAYLVNLAPQDSPKYAYKFSPLLKVQDELQVKIYYYPTGSSEKTYFPMTDDGVFITKEPSVYVELESTVYDPVLSSVDIHKLRLSNFSIWNYSKKASRPIITLNPIIPIGETSSGIYTIQINDTVEIIVDLLHSYYSGPVIIDCEQRECYSPSYQNLNNYVTIRNRNTQLTVDFPELKSGENTFWCSVLGGNCELEVIPKWWTM